MKNLSGILDHRATVLLQRDQMKDQVEGEAPVAATQAPERLSIHPKIRAADIQELLILHPAAEAGEVIKIQEITLREEILQYHL
jgi:hypothetical protein